MAHLDRIKHWKDSDPEEECINCGHKRKDHSDFEESVGNDSHECEYCFELGKAVYKCQCNRYESKY